MVAPQKRSAETANDAAPKKVKFDKSAPFKKSGGGGKFDGKKAFGKPGTFHYYSPMISLQHTDQ